MALVLLKENRRTMHILILLVLLGPGLAVAQYEEDVQCASEGGVCQDNDKTCNGTYVVGKCGGTVNRQCCVLTTRATAPPFDPPDQETPHGLKIEITSRATQHPLDPSDQDTTPSRTSNFFMDFLLTRRHVDHKESTTKEPKTKHHRWPTINDVLTPSATDGPTPSKPPITYTSDYVLTPSTDGPTPSKPPIKYTSDLSTHGKCEQGGYCHAIGEKCMDKNNPKMHCNGKYYPDKCPASGNCQCCISCNQNQTCSTIGGECQYAGEECKGMYISRKCHGKKHCRCCAPCQQSINCTESNGRCQYTGEECRGTYVEKQCPGPGHCQCCRRCQRYSKHCSSRGGKCQYAGDTCNGEYVNGGECPGGDNCQCCLRCKQYSEQCSSRGGKCQYVGGTCNGGYVKDKCPEGDNCQCCLPCKQGGTCQALGETCQEKNNPNVTCNGKYYPDMCSLDAENCQCCIECKQNKNCSIFGGVCQYVGEKCRGTYIPYQCSEKRHCQCCVPCQEYSEKCSSVGGKCQFIGDKCDGISVKKLCNGANCQCCVPKWKPFCHGDVENVVRGCEGKFWCGRYRSHRPHGKHMGVDIICPDGSRVNAPFKGELKGWVRAYKKNNAINDGVMLSNSVFCIIILYIHADSYTGSVDIGQKIGYLLNVQSVYPGITSHIHVKMCHKSKDPTFYLN